METISAAKKYNIVPKRQAWKKLITPPMSLLYLFVNEYAIKGTAKDKA
jgi:hypothetical protein